MISPLSIVTSTPECSFFLENFNTYDYTFLINDYNYLFVLTDYSNYSNIKIINTFTYHNKSLITLIDHLENSEIYNNLENITSIYHYSIPNIKLSYPEPFIASPSFIHSDLWFVHILNFQYWLWFFFIFIIVFFFLTFLCTVRWCNMRVRPRKETRGVSRSKCGDLITAFVPVSWAISIIISESTNANDYYDGFGTTELVIGIKAYQWGWEYYYPKDIDLNYNIKPSYSSFTGNSLKYTKSSEKTLQFNNLWKYYQNKSTDQIITPAHLLVIPTDNNKFLNFLNFNDIGSNSIQELNAFKKIKTFSKTYLSNLVLPTTNYSNKYKNFSKLYINDFIFLDSSNYGMKRQHNFLSSNALLNNQSTFLNTKSANKFINFNFNNKLLTNQFLVTNNNKLNYFNKNFLFFYFLNYNDFEYISNKLFLSPLKLSLKNFYNYSNFLSIINNDNDKKIFNKPLLKIFNLKLKNFNFYNLLNLNSINNLNENSTFILNREEKNYFYNFSNNYKNFFNSSLYQSLNPQERFIRKNIKLSPFVSHLNYSLNTNILEEYISKLKTSHGLNNFDFFTFSNFEWNSFISLNKYLSAKPFFGYNYSPILNNNPFLNSLNYDDLINNTNNKSLPNIFQGEEKLLSNLLINIYWNFYWSNSSIEWKIYNDIPYQSIHQSFYLPMFNFYYNYDFRNWQSLELLEDLYWESIYSIFTNDEYLNLSKDFYDYEYFNKFSLIYNKLNKEINFKNKVLTKSFFKNTLIKNKTYPITLYIDDFINSTNLLVTKDFFFFPSFSILNNIDNSYEILKFLNYFFNTNNKIILNSLNYNLGSHNYSFVFDMFRSNYNKFSFFFDENNIFNNNFFNFNLNNKYLFDNLNIIDDLSINKLNKFNNNINLRAPVKNLITNFNAIEKTFYLKFNKNYSNIKLLDISNSYINQPLINSPRINYEKLLGKNKQNFFKINLYKNNFQNYFNNLYDSFTSLNFYFFDFPFLLAINSESSRYLWFDWFAKWGYYLIQPSSSSRYAIYGMPYFSKPFDFTTLNNKVFNENETYFLRLSRSRRNYIPNWIYTPYFYSRNTSWYRNNLIYNIINLNENLLSSSQNLLNIMNWYWKNLYFINYLNYLFNPSNSGITSYNKLNWKPKNLIQSYYYNISTLIDILTKREFLYREYLSNNNKIISLPFYLTNNPSNPLINEIKSSFIFFDPINLNNEYSRDIYFNSLNFFNFNILKSILSNYFEILNLSFLNDYLIYYFFNEKINNNLQYNSELYKNQFRPMKKGITNMVKLHATNAIAMPIEIRLQILASSKDIIHSWAIPSAGIKIDCVPGYSSHRVMVFLVSGIFWGQCMEICGRYHHWMPIIVYFMKRDLFFLWCTHFVFLTGSNNIWNINDRQYIDYVKTVSFDKYSWISEINK